MGTTYAPIGVGLKKVVVAYLDDRRLPGCVHDFSPLKDTFRLVAEGDVSEQKGVEVALKDLKAVFFVKDFRGNSKYKESQKIAEGKPGRKIEVTFQEQRLFCNPRGRQEQQSAGICGELERTRREVPLKRRRSPRSRQGSTSPKNCYLFLLAVEVRVAAHDAQLRIAAQTLKSGYVTLRRLRGYRKEARGQLNRFNVGGVTRSRWNSVLTPMRWENLCQVVVTLL
jgi:hypothetical protein